MEILLSTKQRILALAGQSGGKSHTAGLISAEFIVHFPHARGFIGANTYGQLSKATLDRVFQVWGEMFGWKRDVHYVVNNAPNPDWIKHGQKLENYDKTICFNNGAVIFTASLDNYKSIDGSQFTWAILDETKDTKEEAVKEVITGRLRQRTLWTKDGSVYGHEIEGGESWNPLYVLTSPAKVRWINEWFELDDKYDEISKKIFSKTDYYSLVTKDKHVVIYSAYHNEDNLPKNFIEQRIADLKGSPHLIDMLIYGSPIAKSGGEFFSQFSRTEHVRQVDFIRDVPIHISLDFNVAPYITMTCWQIIRDGEKFKANCFDEFCLSSPSNNTEALCKAFELKYLYEKKVPLFYYGDASGSNQSTVSKEHNFDILERVLRKYLNDNSKRVMRKNPSVVGSRDFINKIFANGLPIEIAVSERCKNLIADLEFMKEAPDGGKLIEKAKDPVTGSTHEKYGHCFVAGTMIETINGQVSIDKIKVGDLVLTRNGYKKVTRAFLSRKNAIVNTYDFGFTKVECTPDHKFYANGMFKQASLLTRNDILCIFDSNKKSICKKKLSYSTEQSSIDTRKVNHCQTENITKDGSRLKGSEPNLICTESYGWIRMEKFRKAITFIIRTIIFPITILVTLSVLTRKLISQIIIIQCPRNGNRKEQETCLLSDKKRLSCGTNQRLAVNGIHPTILILWLRHLFQQRKNVLCAIKHSLTNLHIKNLSIVQTIASLNFEESQRLIGRLEDVLFVTKNFLLINTFQEQTAEGFAIKNSKTNRDVYDLEVEGEHEFFANGILVHNCSDSLRYFLVSAFTNYFKPE